MKKFLLTLILCIGLVVGGFSFSACKKDEGYKLSQLLIDYQAIASDCKAVEYKEYITPSNTTLKRLQFNYSAFVNARGQQYLKDAIDNSSAPYKYVKDYNAILYNSLEFFNLNINNLSTDAFQVEVSKSLRNNLKSKLDNFKKAITKTDIQVQEFARNINTNSGRDDQNSQLTNELYLQTFKHLLDSYNNLYEAAFDLTQATAKVYYSISDNFQNIDFSTTKPEELSNDQIADFLTGLTNRTAVSIACYSYTFYQNTIQSGELSSKLITKVGDSFAPMGEQYDAYVEKIGNFSKSLSNIKPENIDSEKKVQIYNLAIELHNIWNVLSNDYEKFFKAYTTIDYNLTKTAFDKTDYEIYCAEIIENYFYLFEQNINSLVKVYELI